MQHPFNRFALTIVPLAIIVLSITADCKKNPTSPLVTPAWISIEVGSDYQNDYITLNFNDSLLTQGRVTTNFSISAAWLSGLIKRNEGDVHVGIVLPEFQLQKDTTFFLRDTMSIEINFDRTNRTLSFWVHPGFYLRD